MSFSAGLPRSRLDRACEEPPLVNACGQFISMDDFRDAIVESAARMISPTGQPSSSISSHKTDAVVLSHTNQLFSTFMDHLPAFAWIKDIQGRYLYVNRQVVERFVPFKQGWLGKTDADLWPSELAAEYHANDLKVSTTGKKIETVTSFVVNGEQRDALVSKFPIFDRSGNSNHGRRH